MMRWGRLAVGTGMLMLTAVAGCGGGSSGATTTGSKAGWIRQHGAAVAAVGTELDLARKALGQGDRQSMIGACSLLRDNVIEARKGLPVPDAGVDPALRRGLDAVDTGAADCLQGARTASSAITNERAMTELADARSRMDAANQALAAWR